MATTQERSAHAAIEGASTLAQYGALQSGQADAITKTLSEMQTAWARFLVDASVTWGPD